MPLPWLRSILAAAEGDAFHADGRLTATRLLGCPRETIIGDFIPSVIDPRQLHALHMGSTIHAELERWSLPGQYGEVRLPPEGEPLPELLGVQVSGKVDHVTADLGEIADYKIHSEGAQRWKKPVAEGDDTAQVNIYRILIAKSVLKQDPATYRPRMSIWHGAMTSKRGPEPWIHATVPLWDEGMIGRFRPKGGHYTVAEIIDQYKFAWKSKAEGWSWEDIVSGLPLSGLEMMNGKKCDEYCVVSRTCKGLRGQKETII